VPECTIVRSGQNISGLHIQTPCAVKPRYEGSSIGLSIVWSKDFLQEAIDKARKFSEEVIVEDFISGREMTVGVLGEDPLPVVEIVTKDTVYDFNAKYESCDTEYIVPAKLKKNMYQSVQKIGLTAHMALGCRCFSRVDLRLSDKGEMFVLEVNTIPGLTKKSLLPMAAKAAGLDFSELCVKMLSGALL